MSSALNVAYIGEGLADVAVARKMILAAGGMPGIDFLTARKQRGKHSLDMRLDGLNRLARIGQVVLALRDFDVDDGEPCPGALVGRLVPAPEPLLCLRIAMRSVEAWLLADRECFAQAIGVSVISVTSDPEALLRPKDHIVALARKSRSRSVKRDLIPEEDAGITEGPLFGVWLSNFAAQAWDPKRAAATGRSSSLSKALIRLQGMLQLNSKDRR